MASLLDTLRVDAANLLQGKSPSAHEALSVLGALIERLEGTEVLAGEDDDTLAQRQAAEPAPPESAALPPTAPGAPLPPSTPPLAPAPVAETTDTPGAATPGAVPADVSAPAGSPSPVPAPEPSADDEAAEQVADDNLRSELDKANAVIAELQDELAKRPGPPTVTSDPNSPPLEPAAAAPAEPSPPPAP